MRSVLIAVALLAGCNPAANTTPKAPEPHVGHTAKAGESAATTGYRKSMTTMMAAMPAFTGDADRDFMQEMRVHHIAAVEMAQVELGAWQERRGARAGDRDHRRAATRDYSNRPMVERGLTATA